VRKFCGRKKEENENWEAYFLFGSMHRYHIVLYDIIG